jgi:hypothetical protein
MLSVTTLVYVQRTQVNSQWKYIEAHESKGTLETRIIGRTFEGEEGALEEEVWKSEEAEGLLRRCFLSFDKL